MDRPKRVRKKPENLLPPPDKLDLSELEDDESDGDFSSASSDEYNPNVSKHKSVSESSDDDDDDDDAAVSSESGSDAENNSESPIKRPQSSRASKCSRNGMHGRKSHIATLRKEVINKFKNSAQKSTTNQKLKDILKKAQFSKKSIFDGSESEDENEAPNFDCSGGLQLSDCGSDSESEKEIVSKSVLTNQKKKDHVENSQSNDSDSERDANGLMAVHDNLQKMKEITEKLAETANKQVSKVSSKENVNVSDILAMGESVKDARSKASKSKSQKKRAAQSDESDSDNWEDVEEDDSRSYRRPKEGVEILLNDFGQQNERGKQTKPVDVEAQLKRKFNRIRKEHQEYLHKSQLLSWIGHGNFVNCRLNNVDLIKSVLKLLPNNKGQCYPKDKTDISYFKQITKYYKQEMELKNSDMYCTRLKNRPPLMLSLALQMKFKAAICRRDYVLIFASLLRAIGIQCRVVNSLVCDPKVCPKSELLSLSKKPTEEAKNKPSTSRKSSSKASNKKRNKIKIPQLDGGDDEVPKRKTRSAKNDRTLPKQLKSSHTSETLSPKVKVSVESPNRKEKQKNSDAKLKNGKEKLSENAKKIRSVEMIKKATLNVLSPRKTRSMSRDQSPKPSTSSQLPKSSSSTNAKKVNEIKPAATKKDTLKIILPRTNRSRSRSEEPKTTKATNKPNLQKLATKRKAENVSGETLEPKIAKVAEKSPIKPSKSRKREANSQSNEVEKKKPRVAKISETSDDGSLKFFKLDKSTKLSPANTSKATKIDRRILSTDDDEKDVKVLNASPKKSKGIDIWVEVYSEKEEKWIAIDVFHGKVDCAQEISKKCTQPVVYVFAWNNDNSIKDISARYCKDFNTRIRKMRVDREYLNSVLNMFAGIRTSRDFKEDDELNIIQFKEEMPKSIAEFKNHPLYALKRHLLKFQAIYPPEPPILGYIREEAIYPRDCVFTMHSRETWLKEARVVKLYEKPYKMVTTLKWDKGKNKLLKDVPLELFGIWQTKDYEPPVAENGVVPRNGYGNVELFKPCMLPIGTVHLQLPGLNRVCKKLNIDCAQAVVGFDSNGGWPYPVYDGFVVCKEFEEKVIDAWNRDRDEMEKKEREKFEKRVYGNWKQLIKGLIIRERLKQKYNFEQK